MLIVKYKSGAIRYSEVEQAMGQGGRMPPPDLDAMGRD